MNLIHASLKRIKATIWVSIPEKFLWAVKGVSEPYAPNSGTLLALISCKFSFTNIQFEEQQYNPEEIRGCSPSIQKHWHYCHNFIFAKPSLVHLEVVEQEIK